MEFLILLILGVILGTSIVLIGSHFGWPLWFQIVLCFIAGGALDWAFHG